MAFRFSRRACDLEYGRWDVSISSGWFRSTREEIDSLNTLSSNLARLSVLFAFFEMGGLGSDSVKNVPKISVACNVSVTAAHERYTVDWGVHLLSSASRCQSLRALPDSPGLRTFASPQTARHDREPWFENELPLATLQIQYQSTGDGIATRKDLPWFFAIAEA